jgi:hypothetical protein
MTMNHLRLKHARHDETRIDNLAFSTILSQQGREQARWSIADLAVHTKGFPGKVQGLSEQQIKRIEHKHVNLQPNTLAQLEYAFQKQLGSSFTLSRSTPRPSRRKSHKSPKRR